MSDFKLKRQKGELVPSRSTTNCKVKTEPLERSPDTLINKRSFHSNNRISILNYQLTRKKKQISNKMSHHFDFGEGCLEEIISNKHQIMRVKEAQHHHWKLISKTESAGHMHEQNSEEIECQEQYKEASTHNLKYFINKYFDRKNRRQLRDRYVSLVLNEQEGLGLNQKKVNGKLFRLPPIMISSFQY